MITCQHEWVDHCQARYRCEPPVGYHFENAHYPLSEKLGGTDTVPLWYPDHIVQGILQTLEYEYPCIDTRKYAIESKILGEVYPEYLDLYWEAYSYCKSFAAKIIAPVNGERAGERSKRLCINVCNPTNQEKGRQTQRQQRIGFYSFDFQHTPEMQEMRRQNGIKSGAKAVSTGQLAAARASIDKRNQARAGTENLKKAHEKIRKPVEVTTPQGQVIQFASISEAAKALSIDASCIAGAARNPGKKTKGHTARFM